MGLLRRDYRMNARRVATTTVLCILCLMGALPSLAQQPRAATQPTTKPTKLKANPSQPTTRAFAGPTPWLSYHKRYSDRAQAASRWPVNIVFFGDSITEWWPWQDFKARYEKKMAAVNFGIG